MKKICFLVLAFVLMLSGTSFAIVDWVRGDGTDAVKGTDNASDIDYDVTNYLQDPLDRMLMHYVWGCTLTRTSATVVTVSAGEVCCSNGAATIKRMRRNSSTTTIDMTAAGVGGIDSGSAEKNSQWYDLYAVADADATTFTAICAEQGTALSDVTYYRYIGSFYNDSGGDILNFYWFGNGNDITVMWDVPVNITTTVSAGAWSAATSCSSAMPSSSSMCIFGMYSAQAGGSAAGIWIRPNGSTWATGYENGLFHEDTGGGTPTIGAQRLCKTDSSQRIQYYSDAADTATSIDVEGFVFNR